MKPTLPSPSESFAEFAKRIVAEREAVRLRLAKEAVPGTVWTFNGSAYSAIVVGELTPGRVRVCRFDSAIYGHCDLAPADVPGYLLEHFGTRIVPAAAPEWLAGPGGPLVTAS